MRLFISLAMLPLSVWFVFTTSWGDIGRTFWVCMAVFYAWLLNEELGR